MRNQQIKKVNRIFFSGQDDDKRKWMEQMAAEGWQLLSETAFVYSFQRITSEKNEIPPSYRSILGLDLQKSMPIFQDSRQDWVMQLSVRDIEQNASIPSLMPKLSFPKSSNTAKIRQFLLGTLAFLLFLIASLTKIVIISHGDFIALFKWQFLTILLLIGLSLAFGAAMLFKSFLRILALECKIKK